MLLHAALLFSFTTSALSLECYQGIEGAVTRRTVLEKVCIYETNTPCDFKTLPESKKNFYVANPGKTFNRCWTGPNRTLCACDTDRCNGNFKLLLNLWMKSRHTNQTQKECVAEYLRKKKNLDLTESSITTFTTEKSNSSTSDWEMSTKSANLTKMNTAKMAESSKLAEKANFSTIKLLATLKTETIASAKSMKSRVTFANYPNSSTPRQKTPGISATTHGPRTSKAPQEPFNYDDDDDITPPAQSHIKDGKKSKKSTTKSSIVAYATICVVLLVLLFVVLPLIALCVVYRKRRKGRKTPAKQVISGQFAKQVPKRSVVVPSQTVKQKQAENVQASRQSSGQSFNWNSLNPQQVPGYSSQSNTRQDTLQSSAQEAQRGNKGQFKHSKQSQTKKSGGKSRFQFWKRDPHPNADSKMVKIDSTTKTGTAVTGSNEMQGLHY
ncbi:unnamed protein product [Cylicocyclus nassatus]|uniref:Uncharacterized protein n=1 Tax=Cylicocyclus nassatus TaxID=53992 RepID=A0AA36DID4_CYLNA|nr:unnamed protein product [Cylicocyclus nassatus]